MILESVARGLAERNPELYRFLYSRRRIEKRIVSDARAMSIEEREAISQKFHDEIDRIFCEAEKRGEQPKVSIVVPLRNAQASNVRKMMDAFKAHDYPNIELILVGGKDDTTWSHLNEDDKEWGKFEEDASWSRIDPSELKNYSENAAAIRVLRGGRLTLVEVTLVKVWDVWQQEWVEWIGRDTNVKRNVGCRLASGDIFALTDNKITYPEGYLYKGLAELREHGTGAVAGEVKGRDEDEHDWIHVFGSPGGSFIRRFPTFGSSFELNQDTIAKGKAPVTASWIMLRIAFELMGGFDERATTSYEDFMSCVKFVERGGTFWLCNHEEFKVEHGTRKAWKDMVREWKRSGTGAEDTWEYYPNSLFSKQRLKGVLFVSGAYAAVGIVTLLLALFGLYTVIGLGVCAGILLYTAVGTHNMRTSKHGYGFFFPAITAYLITLFTYSFIRQYFMRDGAARLLQMMWQFQWQFI